MSGPTRFIVFSMIGSLVGAVLGLIATTVDGTGLAVEEYIINAIIGLIGGGLFGVVGHILTRKAEGGSVVSVAGAPVGKCNLFRDDKWIVVPLVNAVFPNRCIKTGTPVHSVDYIFATALSPQHLKGVGQLALSDIAARVAFGRAGSALLKGAKEIANSVPLEYSIGLCDAKRKARKMLTVWSTVLLIGFAPIALIGAPVASATEKAYGSPYLPAVLFFFVIGALMLIGGIILFALRSNLLSVQRCNGEYVWMGGACPEFLETLPVYAGTNRVKS